MPRRPNAGWIVLVLAMIVLPAAYMGSYYAMLDEPEWPAPKAYIHPTSGRLIVVPNYRMNHEIVDKLFWPAHQIDRRIRRDRW